MSTLPFSESITKGGFVFTSGQIHLTISGDLLEGSIEEQTELTMKNMERVLKNAGLSFKDVVKTTIYLTDMSLYEKVNKKYVSFLTKPYPARETIGVKELPLGARLEISMIAKAEK